MVNKKILTDADISHLFSHFKDTQNTFIHRVLKALPDIVYVMKLDDYGMIYSSGLMAHEIGYSEEEVERMNHPILDILHPQDRERFLQHLEDVKNSAPGDVLSIEYRLIKKDGKLAWFIDRNTLFTSTNKEAPTKIGISHQITERKEYEQALIKNEKIMQQAENLAQIGSWDYDFPSKIFTWSEGMYKLFDIPTGTKVHPSIYKDYCIKGDLAIANRIVDSIEIYNNTFEERLQIEVNGNIKTIKIKADPVLDLMGSKQFVGVDQDITVIEKSKNRLQTLNKELAAKSHDNELLHQDLKIFSDVTSSNYQTNLKQIYTAFEAFINNETGNVSNHGKGALRKIQGSIQKMNLLTNDIEQYLSLTKDQQSITLVSLDEVFAEIIHQFETEISLSEITIHKNELGRVNGDFKLIRILFRNLIDNALKFRKEDGKTIISIISTVEDGGDDKGNLSIIVEDNGIGILQEDTEQVFDLFFKNHRDRKIRGSGVGLAVAKKIMAIHNGNISIEGLQNGGTRIVLHFPSE